MGASAGTLWFALNVSFPADPAPMLSASITLGAILSGFLATAKTILISMPSKLKKQLDESGFINDLLSYFAQGIWFSILFSVYSITGFFSAGDIYQIIWVVLGVISLFAFIRITTILFKVISISNGV